MTFKDTPDVRTERTPADAAEMFTKGAMLAVTIYSAVKAVQSSSKKEPPTR